MSAKLIVFSDLDGTLLDRDTYSFAAAQPALETLAARQNPLILNSSKTIAEITALREQMGNSHPFVVENGAAVIVPNNYFTHADGLEPIDEELIKGAYLIKRFSKSYAQIIEVLRHARESGFQFAGFNDWGAAELASISGLDKASAARAKLRLGSEPIVLEGDTETFSTFLNAFGLKTVQGGRFLHVMGQYDKADGVKWLLKAYGEKFKDNELISIALGDSHNDVGMLDAVDIPIVIASEHSQQIQLLHPENAIYSTGLGPVGWNETMQTALQTFAKTF